MSLIDGGVTEGRATSEEGVAESKVASEEDAARGRLRLMKALMLWRRLCRGMRVHGQRSRKRYKPCGATKQEEVWDYVHAGI
jgi:hypothetical protein